MKTRDLLPPTLATLALSLVLVGFCMYVTVRPAEIRPRPASKKSPPGVASISFVEGQAEIRSPGGVWTPARRGDLLRPGDAIRTGVDGRMELRLRDLPGRLRLDRETVFSLWGDRRDEPAAGGRVTKGSVWADVGAWKAGGNRFVLDSPTARASAEEAVFQMHVLRPDSVQLSVYDGVARAGFSGGRTGGTAAGNLERAQQPVLVGQALTLVPGRAPVLSRVDPQGDWTNGWRNPSAEARRWPEESGGARPRVTALRRDLREINPEVYLSVEVELKGRQRGDAPFRPEEVRLRKIQIRSQTWDSLAPAKKVDLLNETFTFLKGRYPNIKHSVILKFDDGRPDLELKYASSLKG